ncbi:MAG TPA: glycerate kinase [Xanthomonadaceae bacterium]|nr:glycerate kinase [Xanthomonadaceae bacterium]
MTRGYGFERSAQARLLSRMFGAAVARAQAATCLPAHLPPPPAGRLVVIGAGKASAAMACTVENHWAGGLSGLVVTRYGYGVPCRSIEVVEAAHPVPDDTGMAAASRMLSMVEGLGADDLVLCLMSGGGSSLLALPAHGIALEDKQAIGRGLLRSGATISEINCVRRHLSAVKGGRLAVACYPARVLTLLISDVPGDNPIDIASGPTVADPTTCADALAILRRYRIEVPAKVADLLGGGHLESIKPGDPRLARSEIRVVATPQMALDAAAAVAAEAGIPAYVLSDALEGEAREVGKVLAAIARQVAKAGQPFTPPCILLSGGETTVTVRGSGSGGRNVDGLLAMAIALEGERGVHALMADTDGVDGSREIAGGCIYPDTLSRARQSGINPQDRLEQNGGHDFFEAIGDSLITGPTFTNVNDFRAVFIEA